MKVDVLGLDGKRMGSIELPNQFYEEYSPEIIKRAVHAIQSRKRQPYGAFERAGKEYSAKLSRRRRNYKTAYGIGISRVPRKIMSRSGRRFNWVGAWAPGTVGGRKAHPPKAEKKWEHKINIKERRKAIRSAISATLNKELVIQRGHKFKEVPLIIENKVESIDKTKDVKLLFKILGLNEELERIEERKVRAGKGKSRGRKYKLKKGPLIVVSTKCKLEKAARNIPGVDVAVVGSLNAELLAPGTMAGRLTIWSDRAIERLAKENMFTNNPIVKGAK